MKLTQHERSSEEFSKVSLVGYICLSFSILVFNYVSVFHPLLWERYLPEDGVVENLQAGFFLLSGIGLFILAFVNRDTWRWLVFLLAGLVMMFIAGEEISWGQRIFGFESPEWFKTFNSQKETNIHNLDSVGAERIQLIFISVCACVSFAARLSNRSKLFGIPYPSLPLAFGLLIAVSYQKWLLPGSFLDILFEVTNAKYTLLVFLLAYIGFRIFADKDKKLALIACATIALILSSEYASYVWNYATHTSGLHVGPHMHTETREYVLSLICIFYVIELWSHLRHSTELINQQSIAKTPRGGEGWWLSVCSVVTVCSIGLVPAGQLYTSHIKGDIMDRFYLEIAPSGPVAMSMFGVYATEDQLTYHKQPCAPADVENYFFLYVVPIRVQDLPEDRRYEGQIGYLFKINDHFKVGDHFKIDGIGDSCIRIVDLPDYEIASIRTGQFSNEGVVWEVEIPFPPNVDPNVDRE